MKLIEALPKPQQVALGGVDPGQAKIQVSGFGVLTYEQVHKELEKLSKELAHYLEMSQNPDSELEMSGKQTAKKYSVFNLKMLSDKLNAFLPALIQHLEQNK